MTGPQLSDWNDNNTQLKFFKPKEGNNALRVVSSKFATTYTHWVKTLGGKLNKATCLGKESCPVCAAGVDLLIRNVFFILDRADADIKLYEAPKDVFQQLKAFAQHPDYGDLTGYDVNVQRSGSGLMTKYQVVASRQNKPLTPEEAERVESSVDLELITKLYVTKTKEQLDSLVENLDPEFIVEIEEKRKKRAEKDNKPYTPLARPEKQLAPVKAQVSQAKLQDEEAFFEDAAKELTGDEDLDLNW